MRRLLLVAVSLVVSLALAEILVRAAVHVDADGQRWLGEHRLLPYRLPLSELEKRVAELSDPASLFVYDSDLGWSLRPGVRSRDGMFSADETGARRTGSASSDESALRIVTVGDSFTFGDEVGDDQTWPAQLERLLGSEERPVDVINLGVNGYGVDQAVLRYERDGASREPDVVILGLQAENLLRNLNVVRAIYFPGTSLPLSKPRFVLGGEGLRLVNRPTATPEQVLEALEDPTGHPLFEYEGWLDWRFERSGAEASALVSLVRSLADRHPRDTGYVLTQEMAAIGTRTIDRLANAAKADGARFLVVHVPRRHDLQTIAGGDAPWYGAWIDEIGARHELVRPELDAADSLFEPGGHYSQAQNLHVAETLAERF